MSRGARWSLGLAMILIAAGSAGMPWYLHWLTGLPVNLPPAMVGITLSLAIFPALIAVACFSRTVRPIAVRLIAATVLIMSLGYVASQIAAFKSIEGELAGPKNRPNLLNSIEFAMVFGLPSAYVLLIGRYPRWGHHGAAFADEVEDLEARR